MSDVLGHCIAVLVLTMSKKRITPPLCKVKVTSFQVDRYIETELVCPYFNVTGSFGDSAHKSLP